MKLYHISALRALPDSILFVVPHALGTYIWGSWSPPTPLLPFPAPLTRPMSTTYPVMDNGKTLARDPPSRAGASPWANMKFFLPPHSSIPFLHCLMDSVSHLPPAKKLPGVHPPGTEFPLERTRPPPSPAPSTYPRPMVSASLLSVSAGRVGGADKPLRSKLPIGMTWFVPSPPSSVPLTCTCPMASNPLLSSSASREGYARIYFSRGTPSGSRSAPRENTVLFSPPLCPPLPFTLPLMTPEPCPYPLPLPLLSTSKLCTPTPLLLPTLDPHSSPDPILLLTPAPILS